jgi:branched-chain amino acid transport system substrate-binding protein
LKGKGQTGAAYVFPFSTGVTFALTEKTPIDKIPLISMGYGRSESRDGSVFQWNFPLLGTYWTAADIILQFIADQERGWDKLFQVTDNCASKNRLLAARAEGATRRSMHSQMLKDA